MYDSEDQLKGEWRVSRDDPVAAMTKNSDLVEYRGQNVEEEVVRKEEYCIGAGEGWCVEYKGACESAMQTRDA